MERKANVEGERPGAPLTGATKLSVSLHHLDSRLKMASHFCLSVGQDRRGCGESARAGPSTHRVLRAWFRYCYSRLSTENPGVKGSQCVLFV